MDAELLLKACRYGADDLHDGDMLCVVATILLNHADGLDSETCSQGQECTVYADKLRYWAGELLKKQSLQLQALESVNCRDVAMANAHLSDSATLEALKTLLFACRDGTVFSERFLARQQAVAAIAKAEGK